MKATIRGYIFASKATRYDVEKGEYIESVSFDFATWNRQEYDANLVKVRDHQFEIEVPDDFDLRPGLVENLEREKRKVTAEFQARITQINGEIQQYLAIENNPSEVVS